MSIYVNLVEAEIRCTPEAFYDLVATPDNWPKVHPLNAGVSSATHSTAQPAGLGVVFSENIKRPDGVVEATWEVIEATPGKHWKFRSQKFADLPLTMTITWDLEATSNGVRVKRFMRTDVHPGHELPREAAIRFALPDAHEEFVAILKKHLEAKA
ncbi:MAG TPA: SRPBCC family protein [Polyangiaceae bacterium]